MTIRLEEIVYLHCHQQGRDQVDRGAWGTTGGWPGASLESMPASTHPSVSMVRRCGGSPILPVQPQAHGFTSPSLDVICKMGVPVTSSSQHSDRSDLPC
jgi:hypothetical protein